ncbi:MULTISPECIES: hypothetical protein [unclassified Pseudomonas]|uniref:hypothetical protein n=1 Tax=unclassified Pseudomonas TaxID=196821 RepID=UPI001587666B|nr:MULTISPECIES: hypothetical protein [unclassified Pseudomonas]
MSANFEVGVENAIASSLAPTAFVVFGVIHRAENKINTWALKAPPKTPTATAKISLI